MRKLAAAAVIIVAGLAALVPAVSAHHNIPEVTVTEGACGEVTFTANWTEETHTVDNAVLVVATVNGQETAPIGESITVGPIDYASDTILWRVWGGGERAYDNPALSDLDALLDYLEASDTRTPLDISAPVDWNTIEVEGCVPGPEGPQGPEGPEGPTGEGQDGTDGVDGRDGSDATDGQDGTDGVPVTEADEAAPATAVTAEPAFTG